MNCGPQSFTPLYSSAASDWYKRQSPDMHLRRSPTYSFSSELRIQSLPARVLELLPLLLLIRLLRGCQSTRRVSALSRARNVFEVQARVTTTRRTAQRATRGHCPLRAGVQGPKLGGGPRKRQIAARGSLLRSQLLLGAL